jgi:glycosidase
MLAFDFLYPDPYNLVIFPDNHDMSRFFMQLDMDPALYKLGISYILTTRGIPQIFYGSEILMTHTESDHHGHIRKDFPGGWKGDEVNGFTGDGLNAQESEMQDFFRTLLNWRKDNPVIHTGKLIHYAPEKSIYVYGRYNDEQRVMVILNKGKENVTIDMSRFRELSGDYKKGTDLLSGKEYPMSGNLTVPALSPLILDLK